MSNKLLRILVVKPNETPYEATINNTLRDIQKAVGGFFQNVYFEDGCILVCNEEGKLLKLQGNRRVGDDIIVGTFFIVADDNYGDFKSLTDSQLEKYTEMFKDTDEFTGLEIKN